MYTYPQNNICSHLVFDSSRIGSSIKDIKLNFSATVFKYIGITMLEIRAINAKITLLSSGLNKPIIKLLVSRPIIW